MLRALLIPLLACSQAGAEAVRSLSLDDAQRLALLNDARFLSAEQDKIIARERVREARYLFLPEFGLQASATKYEARYPFSLSGESRNILLFPDQSVFGGSTGNIYSGRGYMHLSLYEGRRTINTLRLAQAAQKQADSAHETVKMELLLSVKENFYRLLYAQRRATESESIVKAAEQLVDSSKVEGFERVEAEARLSAARAKASDARQSLQQSRLAFLKSINLELDTPFQLVGDISSNPVSIEIERAVLWAIELRPELQSQTYKAQMDAISVNLAAARRIPTVFLAGDYEVTGPRFPLRQNNWDATIGIRIPFSYDYWSQLRQKRAEQRQGQLKRAELQDRVRLEVRQAYESLQYWQNEWPLREAQYRKVQELFDAAARAAGTTLARLRAMESVYELKLSYLNSLTEHIVARSQLERAIGRELQ